MNLNLEKKPFILSTAKCSLFNINNKDLEMLELEGSVKLIKSNSRTRAIVGKTI